VVEDLVEDEDLWAVDETAPPVIDAVPERPGPAPGPALGAER